MKYTKLDTQENELPDSAESWVMVKDNVTELIWEVKTDDRSIHNKRNMYNLNNAQDVFIAGLNAENYGGFSDWRLPTIEELLSIVDYEQRRPAIDTTVFPNTMTLPYWSSTIAIHANNTYRCVVFCLGYSDFYNKSYPLYVRAVRGEQKG